MTRRAGLRIGDLAATAALICGLLLVALAIEGPERVSLAVRVVDGDTIKQAGVRIRLRGIDAPELAQTCERRGATVRCGEEARDALVQLVAGREVGCRISGHDQYGRSLATCRAGGNDLGATLVRRGFAVAYGGYAIEELAARAERAGIWAGSFERPAEYRRAHPRHSFGSS